MVNYSISEFLQLMNTVFLTPLKACFGYLKNIKIGSTTWLAVIMTFIICLFIILAIVRPSGLNGIGAGISVVSSANRLQDRRRAASERADRRYNRETGN